MAALPNIISAELFNIQFRVSDVAIEHICSKIEEYQYVVGEVQNLDHAIYIDFGTGTAKGQLRIDRMAKSFEICVSADGITVLPTSGSWSDVTAYLDEVSALSK